MARGVITLRELNGQLFHRDAIFHQDTKRAVSSPNKSDCVSRPYGKRDAGLGPIGGGFRAADEVWTGAVKHTPGGPWAFVGVTRSMRIHCARRGLWVRKGGDRQRLVTALLSI